MIYEVVVINPKTNEQRKITLAAIPPDPRMCLQTYVQYIARPEIPKGFLPLGNGVRALPQ
jgi:hypothetical protein